MTNVYRILTYSNSTFVPQRKGLIFWKTLDVVSTKEEALQEISNDKVMRMVPTLVSTEIIN